MWLVYGSGLSAELIARRALDDGVELRLAGRREIAVRSLARTLGSDFTAEPAGLTLDLADEGMLDQALTGVDVLLNTAGPFAQTAGPLAHAALRAGVHYVDLANELTAVEDLLVLDRAARERDVCLVTGAGFGVAATEIVAHELQLRLGSVASIDVAVAPYIARSTPGVRRTVLDVLGRGGSLYKGGALQTSQIGSPSLIVPFATGARRAAAVPTGDLIAVHRATEAGSVTIYSTELPANRLLLRVLPLLAACLRVRPVRRFAEFLSGSGSDPPSNRSAAASEMRDSFAWARATSGAGETATASIRLGEGYEVTAAVAVACAHAVCDGEARGTATPLSLLGDGLRALCGVRTEPEHPDHVDAPADSNTHAERC